MERTIFLCEDTPEGIFTGVYDAWASRRGHSHVKLKLNQMDTMELFSEYVSVAPDAEKAEKVRRSIQRKIGIPAWQAVYRSVLSWEESKADDIYRFLVGGFYYGSQVMGMLAEPAVMRIVELDRAVANEAHYYKEFLRFSESGSENRILCAKMRPKNQVLPLVTHHFAQRLSGENFLILDVGRGLASLHPAGRDWILAELTPAQAEAVPDPGEDDCGELWRTFFQSIAIRQRENSRLQRGNLPLRYREFMNEFEI